MKRKPLFHAEVLSDGKICYFDSETGNHYFWDGERQSWYMVMTVKVLPLEIRDMVLADQESAKVILQLPL